MARRRHAGRPGAWQALARKSQGIYRPQPGPLGADAAARRP
jgi:hypothetical protein